AAGGLAGGAERLVDARTVVPPVEQGLQHLDRLAAWRGQVLVTAEHQPGVVGGGEQQLAVADRVGEAVGRKAALPEAQRVAAAAQAKILLGDLETVLGAAQGLQPDPGGLAKAVVAAAVEQQAGAGG